jgi:hypothetical protein
VPEGDGKIVLNKMDAEDLENIKRHGDFFSGFDFIPGTVEEHSYDNGGSGGDH